MTRRIAVLQLIANLRILQDEAKALGLNESGGIHHMDRETFDQLPGNDMRFLSDGKWVWSKRVDGITIFCNESPIEVAA